MSTARWRWGNVPVPEVYVGVVMAGVGLQVVVRLNLFASQWLALAAGLPTLVAGVLLAAWAVLAAGEVDVARPAALVTSGPYRLSRNPMYLAWTLIAAGIGLAANSAWVVMLLPAGLLFLHFVTIPREERDLERRFGASYVAYARRVRRWL